MLKFTSIWAPVVLSCLAPAVGALNIERMQEGDLDVVRIENRFLVLKVAVNSGARIYSLVSKADGVEQVWWRGSRDAAHSGGLIDDKAGFESAPYTATVEEEGHPVATARGEGRAVATDAGAQGITVGCGPTERYVEQPPQAIRR